MAEIYTSGTAFTTPTTVKAWVEYPFRNQGDSTTKVYHHTMKVKATSYAPLADDDVMTDAGEKPIRSPFSDDSNAFYVGDYDKTEIGDGLIQFDRQFASIPKDRIEPNGFYGFEFPDVPGGISVDKNSTSESSSYNTGTFIVTITATLSASDAENFQDGDVVTINNPSDWNYDVGTLTVTRSNFSGVCSKASNTITLTVRLSYATLVGEEFVETAYTNFTDNTPANYVVKKAISPDRNGSGQFNSPSILSFRYVKTSFPDAIPLRVKYVNANSSGIVSDNLSSSSVPLTLSEYQQAGLSGEYAIAAEDETIKRWKGNIFELSQIQVQPR